jgi:hypothetical protein
MHRAASSLFAGNNSGTRSCADRRNRAQQTSNENSITGHIHLSTDYDLMKINREGYTAVE